MAAQAGVRYSIYKPSVYLETNINGFFNILDVSKNYKVKHFIFASSSSVYGDQKNILLKRVMKLANLYHSMLQLKTNEILAHSYINLQTQSVVCDFLQFMDPMADLIWHLINLQKLPLKKNLLKFLIKANMKEILHMLLMWQVQL